ncbi:MAG: SpoIIE family protein phosphatase [Caldilineaceae bacterium]|nr:SpoIIE family protein phosphatase [Caldilineaceae bacterium]
MTQLEIQAGVAKIGKYATSESGDTVEMVERPHGGISLVVVDGQRSGRSAKTISNLVARKAISLLAEGVRDGAAARATHDYLRTLRGGKVSAELVIVSVDLFTRTLVISRNSRCPVLLHRAGQHEWLSEASEAVGIHPNTKPSITEIGLEAELTVAVFTDGILGAGIRKGKKMDIESVLAEVEATGDTSAQGLADRILAVALALDEGRAQDDCTVLVVKLAANSRGDEVRRLAVSFPL